MQNVSKVNSRSTRCFSGVFIDNFEYIWHIVLMCVLLLLLLLLLFFADFKHVTGGWNTYSLDLNLSMFQIWIDEACQI